MIDIYQDGSGEWRWRLVAGNGKTVADSGEGYRDRLDCLHGARVATTLLVSAAVGGKLLDDREVRGDA
jgi:uncharacterized protein YegP (UPF0339 family)